jgi:hypothetical protein
VGSGARRQAHVVTPAQSANGSGREHQVVFLRNFFDELRRRVPLGK